MNWNLNDYETVESRLSRFIEQYPNFRIETELLENSHTRFVVIAKIWKEASDPNPWATGLAYETISERGVNSTSALENCETSAIGRALANAGFAAKGKRASREEMAKVVAQSPVSPPKVEQKQDSWSVTPTAEPMQLEVTIDQVAQSLNAKVIKEEFKCQHGVMVEKGGMSKATKQPYWGFVCVQKNTTCKPKWAKVGADGKWFFPKENANDYL